MRSIASSTVAAASAATGGQALSEGRRRHVATAAAPQRLVVAIARPRPPERAFCSGNRTLENVVRQLRQQGKLRPNRESESSDMRRQTQDSAEDGAGVIDIDADLLFGIREEEAQEQPEELTLDAPS